jgi:hypothetical protein
MSHRPFDDQSQKRIHLESESILTILKFIEDGKQNLLNSDAIFYEISKIPNSERKAKVSFIASNAREYIQIDEKNT